MSLIKSIIYSLICIIIISLIVNEIGQTKIETHLLTQEHYTE